MSAPPFGLSLYRWASGALAPLAPALLKRRAARGKEDKARLDERLARSDAPRPSGALIWLHGASVGESRITLAIARALCEARADLSILLTSGTMTSAKLIAEHKPERAVHQFLPVDTPAAARAFAARWAPDVAAFAESELWPNLIIETARTGAAMALINARMNEKSLQGWARFPESAAWLLGCFDWIGAADQATAQGLTRLSGRDIPMTGSLKLLAGAPDAALAEHFKAGVGARPAFIAGSTHPGEEAIALDALQRLRAERADTLLLLAPRHPERRQAVLGLIEHAGLRAALRSTGAAPSHDDAVWLIDTMGELPAAYAASPAALVGGSLIQGIGGHTPVEATLAGAGVICGPYWASFEDIYDAYRAHDAVSVVRDAPALAEAVRAIWSGDGPDAQAGQAAIAALQGPGLDAVAAQILALLDAPAEQSA